MWYICPISSSSPFSAYSGAAADTPHLSVVPLAGTITRAISHPDYSHYTIPHRPTTMALTTTTLLNNLMDPGLGLGGRWGRQGDEGEGTQLGKLVGGRDLGMIMNLDCV